MYASGGGASNVASIEVDATAEYTAGQNSVSVVKGAWSGGQATFSPSAGTGASKTVQLSLAGSWNGNVYSYTIKDGQGSTGYTDTIDASARYTAGQNSVSVTKGTWSGGQISFSPSAGTGASKTVQLSQGTVSWDGNTASFPVNDGNGSTGYTCTVNASARYTAGQNSVSVSKGSWSGGQITFSPSAGTGASKTVSLSQGTVSWDGNTASFVIKDGSGSTGYTCTVDASARYKAGNNDAYANQSVVGTCYTITAHSGEWVKVQSLGTGYTRVAYIN